MTEPGDGIQNHSPGAKRAGGITIRGCCRHLASDGEGSYRRRLWLFFGAVVSFIVVSRLTLVLVPDWAFDSLWWATMGKTMAAGGELYRDAMDTKPPLFYYFFYWGYALSATHGMAVVGLQMILLSILTTVTCYFLALELFDRKAALVAAILASCFAFLFKAQEVHGHSAEQFALFPICASYLCLIWGLRGDRRSFPLFLLAGIFIAVATAIRIQMAIHFFAFPGVIALVARRMRRALGFVGGAAASLVAGFLLVTVLLLSLLWSNGVLGLAYDYNFPLQFSYSVENASSFWKIVVMAMRRFGTFVLGNLPFWIFAFVGLFHTLRSKASNQEPRTLIVPIWFVLSGVTACVGFKFAHIYFLPLFPPAALLAARAFTTLLPMLGAVRVKLIVAAFAGSCLFYLCETAIRTAYWYRLVPEKYTLEYYVRGKDRAGSRNDTNYHSLAELDKRSFWTGLLVYLDRPRYEDVSTYLRERSSPGDRLFIWGFAPQIYHHSGLMPATRFFQTYHLTGQPRGKDVQMDLSQPIYRQIWAENLSDLERSRPRFIVDIVRASRLNYLRRPDEFPDLQAFLQDNYSVVAEVALATVYERKSSAPRYPRFGVH